MNLALKVLLLGVGFFVSIYIVTKISDKLQQKSKDDTKESD